MNLDDIKIKQILLDESYLSASELKDAEIYCKDKKIGLKDYLISQKIITKNLLGQAIAESYDLSYADLAIKPPSSEQVLKIPEAVGRKLKAVVYEETNDEVIIAMSSPQKQKLYFYKVSDNFPKKNIKIAFAFEEDIEDCFVHYQKPLETRFKDIIEKKESVASELLNEILRDALTFRTSDIHFDVQEKEVILRFRIDGVLQEAGRFSKELYANILNRLKVQAHLRIDEHLSAQDGAIRFLIDEHSIDLRLSIIPIVDGEKVVIRILSEYIKGFSLEELGFLPEDRALVLEASKKPFGMILATGPTGSGKTTTLYTILKMLNKPDVNITTIEDPVEYKIQGINQIQVNIQTDLTFGKGLRSIVRQDPNIILVGEIRDMETAEIAVNAALTGHLLLSTFHANDAATAIPRLLDMGIEPFLLSSTINLIVAQRLVRKICENCKTSIVITDQGIKDLFNTPDLTLYKGKGCNICNGTGYKGRVALYELIYITEEMQSLILESPSVLQISTLSKEQGGRSFFEDGEVKVKNGITTLEELIRVAPIAHKQKLPIKHGETKGKLKQA